MHVGSRAQKGNKQWQECEMAWRNWNGRSAAAGGRRGQAWYAKQGNSRESGQRRRETGNANGGARSVHGSETKGKKKWKPEANVRAASEGGAERP